MASGGGLLVDEDRTRVGDLGLILHFAVGVLDGHGHVVSP